MRPHFLVGLWVVCCAPTFAQQWRIAPTLGLNTTSVSISDAYRSDLNTATIKTELGIAVKMQIGAFAEYDFTERFAFRTGLFYTPKGFNLTVTSSQAPTTPVKGSLSSSYLEVPVLVNVAVGQKGFRIVGGPSFGLALGGESRLDPVKYLGTTIYNGASTKLTVGSSFTDGLVPTEAGLIIGLIRERDRFNIPIELGVYSQIGLTNYRPDFVNRPAYSVRNTLFGLKAAYFFQVGR